MCPDINPTSVHGPWLEKFEKYCCRAKCEGQFHLSLQPQLEGEGRDGETGEEDVGSLLIDPWPVIHLTVSVYIFIISP